MYAKLGLNSMEAKAFKIYAGRGQVSFGDILTTINIYVTLEQRFTFTSNSTSASTSFYFYLINNFSEDICILLFTVNVDYPQILTGKTWEQMRLEWIAWLESEYGYLKDLVDVA